MTRLRSALLLAAFAATTAGAQPASVASSSRDTALTYVGSGNFIVGRLARECLGLVGRADTPQEVVARWQDRNAPYVDASAKYMEKRLAEAEATGGQAAREALQQAMRNAVIGSGEEAVRAMLQGRREEACMRAISLLDAGGLDISPKTPMYQELEGLVRWAQE